MATWYYSYITALEKRKSMGDAGGDLAGTKEERKKERGTDRPPHVVEPYYPTGQHADAVRGSYQHYPVPVTVCELMKFSGGSSVAGD
jgi:hypothetical protein